MQYFDKTLTARLSKEDVKALTAQAREVNRTKSEYLRGVIQTLSDRNDLKREIYKSLEGRRW